jgi:IMP and pyridine-specific 5'-nucleotidase
MGGECNYLLRVAPAAPGAPRSAPRRLEFVPDAEWKSAEMMAWTDAAIAKLLDDAQRILVDGAARLRVPVCVVRKDRAVGVVPAQPTVYEVLEELAITVQVELAGAALPFCAFNGGGDVFVDVGNKSLGLEALKSYLGLHPGAVLHVGDRFTASGNDSATRDCCPILWVANPEETDFFIKLLLADLPPPQKGG